MPNILSPAGGDCFAVSLFCLREPINANQPFGPA